LKPSQVTIRSEDPVISVTGLLGPDGARITDGYGGWEIVERPRRQGVTLWTGRPPFTMTLDIIFDGLKKLDPIEILCSSLERLALPPNESEEPPVVKVTGVQIPRPGLPWVVENIAWGEAIRNGSGRRLRQVATVTLIRYNKEDRLREQKASARARSTTMNGRVVEAKSGKRIYVAKASDTLASIAATQLGDISRWAEIGELNDIRDPSKSLANRRIRLP